MSGSLNLRTVTKDEFRERMLAIARGEDRFNPDDDGLGPRILGIEEMAGTQVLNSAMDGGTYSLLIRVNAQTAKVRVAWQVFSLGLQGVTVFEAHAKEFALKGRKREVSFELTTALPYGADRRRRIEVVLQPIGFDGLYGTEVCLAQVFDRKGPVGIDDRRRLP